MPALSVAARNVDRHGLSSQVELFDGDLWDALPEPNEDNLFDLIICNPPYVNANSMSVLPTEYHAEPALALAGGDDGMDLIRRIIAHAPDYLSERGAILIEIGNEYENFKKAFPQIPVIWMEVSAGEEQVLLIQAEDLR
jgi:ribosomal protein L3 glutamine methyltransferase